LFLTHETQIRLSIKLTKEMDDEVHWLCWSPRQLCATQVVYQDPKLDSVIKFQPEAVTFYRVKKITDTTTILYLQEK
jgi:hypothetical protein